MEREIEIKLAEVAELADAADSKSAGLNTRVGSTPTFGTNQMTKPPNPRHYWLARPGGFRFRPR